MLHYQAMAKKAMSKKATPKKAKSKARIRHLSDGIEVTIMPKKAMSKMAKKAMSKKAISKAGRPPGTTKQPWWKKQGRPSTGVSGLLIQLAHGSDDILAEEIEALEDLKTEIDETAHGVAKNFLRLRDQLAGVEKNLSWLVQESDEILAEEIEALAALSNKIDERMLALKDRRDKYWLDRRRPLG